MPELQSWSIFFHGFNLNALHYYFRSVAIIVDPIEILYRREFAKVDQTIIKHFHD